MFLLNDNALHGQPLDPVDAETLGVDGADAVEHFLSHRDNHLITPLHALPTLAAELGVGSIHVKDEGFRLGLGSFKALGGAYAVFHLVLEEASRRLGRPVGMTDLNQPEVRAVAATMTMACATDGNHGRSVAQGAQLVGARAAIFVHAGVSEERIAAIARYGAEMIRVDGNYDDSIRDAARVAGEKGWTVVSDTSWPGYERIPGLVMQGYTAIVREALGQLRLPPTHVFVQAGVGGIAAAIAGHLAILFGENRPVFVVVEPARAACILGAAQAGHPVKIAHGEATVMAMLECYEASPVAWRVLARVADAFMTVDEDEAISVMRRLARPHGDDAAIVAGESGGVGLAGLIRAITYNRAELGLGGSSRVLVVNTEGATDPSRYIDLVGMSPADVLAGPAFVGAVP
ncbi:diaminopropionate ammonia-lyase [Mesorhizobium sp. INR15]|uniref:diaminopropionate ammonia-lyase n=1 Tax=Mesorhizobium sp. INR15 TaxID=2654248 RepID=UPI0018968A5B|nr:diaminopropionate ammonia-lyase [Mesorhizobium sp. INR15]QPC93857.1 diaminopropionate ammonia-lyase [Mesorhizobium sp. INR15]